MFTRSLGRLLDAELASRLQALLVHSGDGAVLTKLPGVPSESAVDTLQLSLE